MINTIIRTIFFYFFITLAYRIMGKREVGQLGIIDLIVSILIAELVAISIENYKDSIFLTIVPISILVIIEISLGYLNIKNRKIGKLLDGKPTLIIDSGKLLFNSLIKERYSIDDLLYELRQKGLVSLEEVEYAFLEPNGKLSIFPYKKFKRTSFPLPVIVDGNVQDYVLKRINKSRVWLDDILNANNILVSDIFYGIYNNGRLYLVKYENI